MSTPPIKSTFCLLFLRTLFYKRRVFRYWGSQFASKREINSEDFYEFRIVISVLIPKCTTNLVVIRLEQKKDLEKQYI
jgi:hypothetical protein